MAGVAFESIEWAVCINAEAEMAVALVEKKRRRLMFISGGEWGWGGRVVI